MPELPEVETVKNALLPLVVNKTIKSIDILREKTIISPIDEFIPTLVGQTFLDIKRKGKFLIFVLTNNVILLTHLRMEGKFYEMGESDLLTTHPRIIFNFIDNRKLVFDDSRAFGIMKLDNASTYLNHEPLSLLGPEPMDVTDVDELYEKLHNKKDPIKLALLDQTFLSGLGNIYDDEVLYLSKINPLEKANNITKSELKTIIDNACIVLNKAIKEGGSTVSSFHSINNVTGRFQNELNAYGREGQPCKRCGTPLKKIKIGGRGSTYCPCCQKEKDSQQIIGITGPICSGKSLVTSYLSSLGYKTLSSDEIVKNLYKDKQVLDQLKAHFGSEIIDENGQINKQVLTSIMNKNKTNKKYVEKFIHPLVERKIIDETKLSKSPLVVEIPLLFPAKLEYLCKYIIVITTSKDKQIERVKLRGSNVDLLKLNDSFFYNEDKNVYVINNDKDEKNLYNEVDKILAKINK